MLTVETPNPHITKEVANYYNPVKMYTSGEVLPLSYTTINNCTTGIVGEINLDYMYPLHAIQDCGCGVHVMIYDDGDIPEDIDNIIESLEDNYIDDELDSMLPDLSQYDDSSTVTVDQALKVVECLEKCEELDPYEKMTLNMWIRDIESTRDSRSAARTIPRIVISEY